MVYVVSERPAVGLSGPMADPEVLSSEDTAKSRLALYPPCRPSEPSRWGDEVEDKVENYVFCSPWRALTTSAHDRITWLTPASSQLTFPARWPH